MAYDPQSNPLDAIASERAKQKKKQINPNARTVGDQANVANGVSPGNFKIENKPGMFMAGAGAKSYGLTQSDNQKILSDIAESERQAGREMPKAATPFATIPATQPRSNQSLTSIEDQRLINRMREGGLASKLISDNPNAIQQLNRGTMSPEYKSMFEQSARYNYNQTPATKEIVKQTFGPFPYTGVMTRDVQQPINLESNANTPRLLRGPSNAPFQLGYQPPSLMTGQYPNIPQYLQNAGTSSPIQKETPSGSYTGVMTRNVEQPSSLESYPNIPQLLRGPSNAPFQLGYQPQSLMTGKSADIPQYLRNPESQSYNQDQQQISQQPQAAQPTVAALSPQQQARDKARMLRQQISFEQQGMLEARHARHGSYGDAADAGSLSNIRNLRQELRQYEQAGQSVQQAQTPEQYAERAQQFAAQSATEVGNQIQKELTAASYLPEGSPQRDAANARIQKMQEYVRQQQAVGEALPFNIPGPQPEGAKPIEYSQAVEATQRQQAMAQENMRRRGMDLAEAQKTTAMRELDEQRQKDVGAATQAAKISEIGAPAEKRKQEAQVLEQQGKLVEAQIGELNAKSRLATATSELQKRAEDRQDAAAAWAKDPSNPENQMKLAQATVAQLEVDRQKAVMGGATGLKNKSEIERDMLNAQDQLNQLGISGDTGFEVQAVNATVALASEIGGPDGNAYIGTMWSGNAKAGMEAVAKIDTYAKQLEELSKINPKLAQQKARAFINISPQQMTGSAQSAASAIAAPLIGIGVPSASIIAAPFTLGGSLIGLAGAGAGAGIEAAQMSNASEKQKVVQRFNVARQTLERIASGR